MRSERKLHNGGGGSKTNKTGHEIRMDNVMFCIYLVLYMYLIDLHQDSWVDISQSTTCIHVHDHLCVQPFIM